MKFTDEDLAKQKEQVAALMEEFARLNEAFEAQKKAAGVTDEDLKNANISDLPPAQQAELQQSLNEAKRAGNARVAQMQLTNQPKKLEWGVKTLFACKFRLLVSVTFTK